MPLASLTFNNPAAPSKPPASGSIPTGPKPMGKPEKKEPSFKEKLQQRKKEQLLKQKAELDRRLKTMKLARQVVHRYMEAQEPDELFVQIRPQLVRMKIPVNKVIQEKIKLTQKNIAPKLSLYYLPMRRDFHLDVNAVRSIYSQAKHFNGLTWSAQGPELWLWYPYKPPADTEEKAPPPGTPAVPGRA